MTFYTKNETYHGFFHRACFVKLTECKFEPGSIFWYDQHDASVHGTHFRDFLNDEAWQLLEKDPTSKILIFYADEYYNTIDLEDWFTTIKKRNVKPSQLYIICVDENWRQWTLKQFAKAGLVGVNVQHYNLLMKHVVPRGQRETTQKFSVFSRKYEKWRLKFYLELLQNDLLTHFNYTFNNVDPYGAQPTAIPLDSVKSDIASMGYPINEKISNWVSGMPYTLKTDHVRNKLSDELYEALSTSAINVVIESHFDPFWNFQGHRKLISPEEFSPAFPTEKVYKAIGCGRPFIMFTTPYFLKEFKQLGFKTFSPFIDETYDSIEDNVKRLNAIVEEIKRLSNLKQDVFDTIIKECEEIARHNYKILDEHQNDLKLENKFQWIAPYISVEYSKILLSKP
jgi:hypothetical protein